ncbi:MAG: hypothetical protein HY681_05390 [Chloroflexi bacterium]|nr:hypothetical protein [Chloroflexota bacterium]
MGRYEFYDWVWEKALRELTLQDPTFIAKVQAFARMPEPGEMVPDDTPQPTWRFNAGWTKVFEACEDVEWQVRRLNRCLGKLNPLIHEGVEDSEAAEEFDYHLVSFFMHCYALTEKSERLATLAFRHFSRLSRTNNPKRASAWAQCVKTELADRIDPIRSHLVHGVGGRGAWVTGVTEAQLWEGTVAVQMTPNLFFEQFGVPDTVDRRRARHQQMTVVTLEILNRLGMILDQMREELDKLTA